MRDHAVAEQSLPAAPRAAYGVTWTRKELARRFPGVIVAPKTPKIPLSDRVERSLIDACTDIPAAAIKRMMKDYRCGPSYQLALLQHSHAITIKGAQAERITEAMRERARNKLATNWPHWLAKIEAGSGNADSSVNGLKAGRARV